MTETSDGTVTGSDHPEVAAGLISGSRVPVVAILGRPNVGKSTLVNRIVGGRPAVVESNPGVTRDRRDFFADWAGRSFVVVDTGGWEMDPRDSLSMAIREQAEAALAVADTAIFVVDATGRGRPSAPCPNTGTFGG